jgi:AraC-like DNA-binding protein
MILASGRDDVPQLLARIGLDPGQERDTSSMVDAEAFYSVIETIVADGDHDLPFRCADSLDIDSYGALGLAFKTSVDIRTALVRVERYGTLVSDAIRYELRPTDDRGATFLISGRPAYRLGAQVTNEGALAGVLSFCRQAVAPGRPTSPASVSLTHPRPDRAGRHEDYFDCPVEFGAEFDGLHLDADFLDAPTRLADRALERFLTDRLDDELRTAQTTRGTESQVRRAVSESLADGAPPMRAVAQRLAMSERTLRRRLADEDLRYEEVVTDVQKTVATSLLVTTEQSLVDIAFLTGYSDQTAFHRAFKRWTGKTPQEVRRGGSADTGRSGQSSGR